MQLSECIDLLTGTISIQNNEDGTQTPLRFTPYQMAFYAQDAGYRIRSLASAGICLDCQTDASRLFLRSDFHPGSSRNLWAFDLRINRRLFAHREGNVSQQPQMDWDVVLPSGSKRVQLIFPCLAETRIREISFPDASFVQSTAPATRWLCLGDSITQGYTTQFPGNAYPHAVAHNIQATLLNQSIAGETFRPEMLDKSLSFLPHLITVAYGTNDWTCKSLEQFSQDADAYFSKLRTCWPDVPTVVLTPIWRTDAFDHPERFPFSETDAMLARLAKRHHLHLINGQTLLPAVAALLEDGLHPNDLGHTLYATHLSEQIQAWNRP